MALIWTGELADYGEGFHDTMLRGGRTEQFTELRALIRVAASVADAPFRPRELVRLINDHLEPAIRVPRRLVEDACLSLGRFGVRFDGDHVHPGGRASLVREAAPRPGPFTAQVPATRATSTLPAPRIRPTQPRPTGTLPTATRPTGTLPTGTLPVGARASVAVGPGTHPVGNIPVGQLNRLAPDGVLQGRRRYRLEEKVGEGGMGQVWRARPLDALGPGTPVAIKTIKAPTSAHQAALLREIQLLRELNRTDLFPGVHEDIRADGRVYLVMDWVEGQNLRQLVQNKGLTAIDRSLFLLLMRQIADRLAYLHAWQPRPILFRDLKPSNIMVARGTQRVRLVDFGISHVADAQEGIRAGTPGYMAPETSTGRVSESSDIYALGRTALFLLFGHEQFGGLRRRSEPPESASRALGSSVVAASLRLCAPNPDQRPASALEAFGLLEQASSTNRVADHDLDALWGSPCRSCARPVIQHRAYCSWCGTDQNAKRAATRSVTLADVDVKPALFDGAAAAQASVIEAWHDLARIRSSADLGTLQCLPYIKVQPYDYQRAAAVRVLSRMNGRAMIADDVGLGKTIEGGLVIREYRHRGLAKRVLIVCPAGLLLGQLQQEMRDKFGMEFRQYSSSGDQAGRESTVGPRGLGQAELVIVSFAMLRRREHAPRFRAVEWDMLLVDECHHIKRRTTQTYKVIRSLVTRYVVFMSATPFSGKEEELWTVYSAIRPGYLGATVKTYTQHFSPTGQPTPELRERIRSMTIRRRRQDLLIRFPKRQPVMVSASGDSTFERVKNIVASATRGDGAFARLQYLQQLASSYESLAESKLMHRLGADDRRFLRSLRDTEHPKVRALLDRVIPRIPKAEKVIVFARFRAAQRALARLLHPFGGTHALIQATSAGAKQSLLGRFRDGPERFLICGEGAGEGLNLQFCSVMVNMDLPWNPMRLEQRIGRIQRLGQRRKHVTVVTVVVKDSVEERVYRVLTDKLRMFEHVIGETEQILGRLFGEETQSFERWLAEVLTPTLDADLIRLAAKNREIESATRHVDLDLEEGGRPFDRLFGAADPLAAGDAPVPDQEPIDLSFLEDVDD